MALESVYEQNVGVGDVRVSGEQASERGVVGEDGGNDAEPATSNCEGVASEVKSADKNAKSDCQD